MNDSYSNYRNSLMPDFLNGRTITFWLIGINVVFSVFCWLMNSAFPSFYHYFALNPRLLFHGYIWTLITSMFMHGDLSHLFNNMLVLYFLGNFLERLLGQKKYLKVYLIGGIAGGLAFVFLACIFGTSEIGARIFSSPDSYAVGASGAICTVAGLLAVLTPHLRVMVFFVFPVKMWVLAVLAVFGTWIISIFSNAPIANTAHFGGALAGVLYGLYLKRNYIPLSEDWGESEAVKQASENRRVACYGRAERK